MRSRAAMIRSFVGVFPAVMGMCLALAGCGSGELSEDVDVKIAVLARLYGEYATQHEGRLPVDAAAFRGYLEGLPANQREAMNLQDLDTAFISPRDGEPYVVLYGVRSLSSLAGPGLHGQPVVMYEQVGKEGKRLVANAMGAMAEVSEAEFEKMVPETNRP